MVNLYTESADRELLTRWWFFFESIIIYNALFMYFVPKKLVKTKIFKVEVKGQYLERREDTQGELLITYE